MTEAATTPSRRRRWAREIRDLAGFVLFVGAFQGLIAKHFYIPSESMMPNLLVGDRLVVSKWPYGWSYASAVPHWLPFMQGRLWGKMPERGDIVIAKPMDKNEDYIKRVIGLPGDVLEVRNGVVILNGKPLKQDWLKPMRLPVDANAPCSPTQFPGALTFNPDGTKVCVLPVKRERLPSGRVYTIIDLGPRETDFYGPVRIPDGHVFLMGDNRDNSADSRVAPDRGGLGGSVPWETIGGRAEFLTFSLNGSASFNPLSWLPAFRSQRAGISLYTAKPQDTSRAAKSEGRPVSDYPSHRQKGSRSPQMDR